jgi:hypothetical protein
MFTTAECQSIIFVSKCLHVGLKSIFGAKRCYETAAVKVPFSSAVVKKEYLHGRWRTWQVIRGSARRLHCFQLTEIYCRK